MSDFIVLLGRILMSAVFIVGGWAKFGNPTGWLANTEGVKRFMTLLTSNNLVAAGTTAPTWLAYVIAAIELFGGIAILIGIKTRWVAWALVVWLIIVTALGHPYWLLEGQAYAANKSHFYKNLAIMAAYLLLAVHGPGRYSVDGRHTMV